MTEPWTRRVLLGPGHHERRRRSRNDPARAAWLPLPCTGRGPGWGV